MNYIKIYSDIKFPDRTILEITFLNKADFYDISFQNRNYTIVGGDKDISTNIIVIAENNEVYYITTDDKKISYISENIRIFIKQLLLYDDNINNLSENPKKIQEFRLKILELDANAFKSDNTFWSEIFEEIEYGII